MMTEQEVVDNANSMVIKEMVFINGKEEIVEHYTKSDLIEGYMTVVKPSKIEIEYYNLAIYRKPGIPKYMAVINPDDAKMAIALALEERKKTDDLIRKTKAEEDEAALKAKNDKEAKAEKKAKKKIKKDEERKLAGELAEKELLIREKVEFMGCVVDREVGEMKSLQDKHLLHEKMLAERSV
jgi:hypothetical protein